MRLTVVMSVLNGGKHLRSAVESILNQTHADFTFITVNNGSTDCTGEILEGYAARDARVQVIHNRTTVTYGEGRSQGIELARTEWIALMDADDICEPRRLQRQVQVLRRYGDRLCALGTWARYINEEGKTLGQCIMPPTSLEQFERMFKANAAIALVDPSAMIHRPTFLEAGGYRPECSPAADLDLWYRMSERGKAILVVPEFLFNSRVHAGAESVRRTMLQRKKTHFINHSMRRRRCGLSEMAKNEYLEKVWASPAYRIRKLRTDLALTFYKRAGLHYGAGRHGRLALNLLGASLLKPGYVVNRLVFQRLPCARRLLAGPSC
jgi:glycosyltransferase involved in cell wall biosynthesis